MLITKEIPAAYRLARQVAERNRQRFQQVILTDLAHMARVLVEAEAVHDKVLIAKVKRDIVSHTKRLNGPVPDEHRFPERYSRKEFLKFDLTVAVQEARDCGASDDELGSALVDAVCGGTDEPEDGSLGAALFDWCARDQM